MYMVKFQNNTAVSAAEEGGVTVAVLVGVDVRDGGIGVEDGGMEGGMVGGGTGGCTIDKTTNLPAGRRGSQKGW